MLLSSDVPSIANGVSQQPPAIRLPSQLEGMVNCVPSLVEGTKKRPPREHVSRLSSTVPSNFFSHWINRDANERYYIQITNGDLKVWDLAGNAKTVNFPDGKTYLNSSDPKTSFSCVSVIDYTFIVNKATTVAKTTPSSPPVASSVGMVFVKQAGYSVTYKVYVNGTVKGTHTVPSSSGADTEVIASALATSLTTNLGAGWTIQTYGSVLKINKNDGSAFSLQAKDTVGDSYLYAFTDKVQRFEYLPQKGFDDFQVEVFGDPDNGFDSYYVIYDKDNNTWEETANPREADSLDASTMPHILVRESDGTFTFKKATWASRTAGDRTSAPDPSFVGKKINFVFFARGRLGLLSDDNVIMSAASKDGFFRFFPETVRQVLDTDPIDVAATSTKVSYLKAAIEYDNKIVLASDRTQPVLQADGTFTQSSVSITPGKDFAIDLTADPVTLGKTIIMATSSGDYSGVVEFYVDPDTSKVDAAEATSHIPAYIPSPITKFAVNQKAGLMFALSSGDLHSIFHYSWHWVGNEKVQAAWGVWTVPQGDSVLSAECFDNYLYLIVTRTEGVYLERVNLQPYAKDDNVGFKVRLDGRMEVTGTYNSGTKLTTWTLPAPINTSTPLRVVLGPDFTGRVGDVVSTVSRPSSTTVTAMGDLSAGPVLIGTPYTSRITFSTIVLGQDKGKGRSPLLDGTLHLRSVLIGHAQTGYYAVDITPRNGPTYTDEFFSRRISDSSAILGSLVFEDGTFRVRPLGKADQIEISIHSDSHLPFAILGFSWEGNYSTRSRKV